MILKLYIIAVYDSDDTVIVKACGKVNPVPITSSSNNLKLIFKADNSRNSTGFKALWTTENHINTILSPNYPGLYPNDVNEVSILIVNIDLFLLDIIHKGLDTFC